MNKIDIQELKENPQYFRLAGPGRDKSPQYESAEEWYENYGAHLDTESTGSVMIQSIDYDWLDEKDDATLLADHRDDLDMLTDDEALALISMARNVRAAADDVVSLLRDAAEACEKGDKDAVVEALLAASSLESEHGDDPATQYLADQLLEPTGIFREIDE